LKKIIETIEAPSAIASYSQAVLYEGSKLLFCSGQIGMDPITGELVSGGITAQTERTMNNMKAVLEAAGTSIERIIKATIYFVDMSDYAAINEIYGRYFSHKLPARAAVQVSALPKGALIEIECIAAF